MSFYHAKYIKAEPVAAAYSHNDPAPFFRKSFQLSTLPKQATLSVQSPGFVKVYVNGKDITDHLFLSPISDPQKILWYDTYDVTALLQPGENVLGVIAGNGFLNESFRSAWYYEVAPWRDAPQFMLSLSTDGTPVAVSDVTWRVSKQHSHIIYHHLRSGEWWDMRRYDTAWLFPGFDDSVWENALLREQPFGGVLKPTPCQPVRECAQLSPVSVKAAKDGFLFDFGINISGYVDVTLEAPRGSEISFYYAEEIDEQGNPAHNGMDDTYFYAESPFQLNKLIASGGKDRFKPHFSYHGFRYVLIKGISAPPTAIVACFTHNDVARRSDFTSGSALLNYIFTASIRSTYANMFWCITDCPTREKLGWLNDAQASVEQTMINFDILPLYRKWLADLEAGIFENGLIHGTVPSTDWEWGRECGPVCGGMIYELPYRAYLATGDAKWLVDTLPSLQRYTDYLEASVREDKQFALGDWLGNGNSKRVPKAMVRDFYLVKAWRVTALAGRLAGKGGALQARYEAVRAAFVQKYTDADGRATVTEQTAIAMMLAEGLSRDRAVLAAQLVEVVLRDRCQMTCGMVGVQYIYGALAAIGRGDLAYRMISESEPGYKTWFENGATTLWECWDGLHRGSHNHHMFSNVSGWLFTALLGIAPREDAPGYKALTLQPSFVADIGEVSGYIDTVRGRIAAAWQYREGVFTYTVQLPEGVCATFDGKPLTTGENVFYVKEKKYENR
ncbi:MAG: hypothetical protein E7650_04475 [Ruminococcaceae bacterium]|nr:hypothetical protein [Oscillospiraceae bacterium]